MNATVAWLFLEIPFPRIATVASSLLLSQTRVWIMHKTTTFFSVAFAIALTGTAIAGEPHQEWMKFLKGEWEYEYSTLSGEGGVLKGDVKYNIAAKGSTVVARGTEGKNKWVELIGWQPDRKKMVFLGYGSSNNNYWLAEYSELANERLGGEISGILPDGRFAEGKVVLERAGDNEFEVHLKMTSDDDKIVDVGKFRRVSDEDDDDEDDDEEEDDD